LYGRGSSDMKSAAAVEIIVFKELANILNYPIALQLVTDEEIGGFNGTKYQIEQGVKTDLCIVGEPTNLMINNESKGVMQLKLTSKGISAHSAKLWEGNNAIWEMYNFLNRLNKIYPRLSKSKWKTSINLAKISTTNTANNMVPNECEAILDIRYISVDKNIDNEIKNILPSNFTMQILLKDPMQYSERNTKDMTTLCNSFKRNGVTPKFSKAHFATDLRHYTKLGYMAYSLGPIGNGLHTENEWVNIESTHLYYKILCDFLKNINA
ncbi:MAG: M20/M25/M40 family metallo-hydrolase, partial [bacterium]